MLRFMRMSPKVTLHAEEPVWPNTWLRAVDERERRIILAEFSVGTVCRYSFDWPYGDSRFRDEAVVLLEELTRFTPQPMICIAGWAHDPGGTLRFRHLNLKAKLEKEDWRVVATDGVGVAAKETSPGSLVAEIDAAQSLQAGWFVGFGRWCTAQALAAPPFVGTIRYFCQNGRLAPSREFLQALGETGGGVAYAVEGDDRKPGVVLLSTERLRERLDELISAAP